MANIYTTNEYKGHGKQNYYHYEYREDGDEIEKVRVNRQKFFDGDENNWETSEKVVDSWNKNDDDMPDWLKSKI